VKPRVYSLVLWAFFFLGGCSSEKSLHLFTVSGQTMGTTYSIKFFEKSSYKVSLLKEKVERDLKKVNAQMSTYIEDSEISLFNKGNEQKVTPVSPWFAKVLSVSLEIAQVTGGAFDPTMGPLVNLWGFGPNKHKKPPELKEIQSAKNSVGYEKINLSQTKAGQWVVQKSQKGVYLDLSASAKGFGVDVLSELLSREGLSDHLVEIGGELRSSGAKPGGAPWVVAIEKPVTKPVAKPEDLAGKRSVQQIINLKEASLATSGNYRNFFESGGVVYPHTISRDSGRPVSSRLLSVADALATALMVMGAEKAQAFAKKKKVAAFFIIADKINKESRSLGQKIKGAQPPAVEPQLEVSREHKEGVSSVSLVVTPEFSPYLRKEKQGL